MGGAKRCVFSHHPVGPSACRVLRRRDGEFWNARIISIVRPRQRKGTSHEVPHLLSHDTDRWTLHLLQGAGPERRAAASLAARTSIIFADVGAPLRTALRSLSPYRATFSRLLAHRLA